MPPHQHIPHLKSITDFYRQLRIGTPQGDDFAIMRIEDQPDTKRLEMPLFRCNFYRVVFIKNEGVAFRLPDQQFSTTPNCLYFSYPGKLESWVTSQKIYGYLVCFTEEFVQAQHLLSTQFPFFTFEKSRLLFLDTTAAELLATQQEEMLQEIGSKYPDTKELLALLLQRYLITINRLFASHDDTLSAGRRNAYRIYQAFQSELDHYFTALAAEEVDNQPNVSTIAERLHLHPSYLNTVIKRATGKTASVLIQEKTILEAKSYLLHTDLQMTEIAFLLGFTNTSYFNRLFKKWTNLSPSAFQRQHK